MMPASAPEEDRDPDAALLDRYAAGDAASARILTDRLLPRALAQATALLRDRSDAEDVAQEAMLRLWRAADGWRHGEARVTTWLYRVVRNLAIDRLRKRRPTAPVEMLDPVADPAPAVSETMVKSEQAQAVVRAMRDLPDRQRTALILRHFEGQSNGEIAEDLGCSVEAVESLLARARRDLARRVTVMTEER